MGLREYEKINIAESLLNKALSIYEKGDNYFAALHLAGASEEILGKYLTINGLRNTLEDEKEALISVKYDLFKIRLSEKEAISSLIGAKNAIKHMSSEKDRIVKMNPKKDAEAMLDRAIGNWLRLKRKVTPQMDKFITRNINL
ncbi:MAG: hypothetical protein ABIE75_04645 [Candidatus Omnitrophota bacterium]